MKTLPGKIVRSMSGFFDVDTHEGLIRCRMRGRLKKERKSADIAVVGDEVTISLNEDGSGSIESVASRRSQFSRRQPGPAGRWKEDVMVANLDTLIVVFAFGSPVFHPRMLDRFLVIAEHNQIAARIVANKVDLETEPGQRKSLELYAAIGYPLHFVSAANGTGIDRLRIAIQGQMSAFLGPSGTGKSSLMMALEPELSLRVGATSDAHGKGRHTTRTAELYPMREGGYLVDTPGIRELGTWNIPEESLADCFPDFRPFLGHCRFRNCVHQSEPGCEVREAVSAGDISPLRLDSYHRLLAGDEAELGGR